MANQSTQARTKQISGTFAALLKTLRVPPAILAALSVALLLGNESIRVLGFDLPRTYATVGSVFVLAAIFTSAYRIAGNLNNLLQSNSDKLIDDHQDVISSIHFDTSILNPFSHGTGEIEDYIGTMVIHVPMVIVLVVSTVMMGLSVEATDDMITAGFIIDAPGIYSADELATAEAEFGEYGKVLLTQLVYHVAIVLLAIVYVLFLMRITSLMWVINRADAPKRIGYMGVSFIIFAAFFILLDVISTWRSTAPIIGFFWEVILD